MNVALLVCTIIGSTITLVVAMASFAWWVYRRGVAAGLERAGRVGDQARIDTLERELAQTQAELTAIQPKRRRA
jgi:hypothetical protein